ncbi:MAG: LamG domain-containing protein [bacterium]
MYPTEIDTIATMPASSTLSAAGHSIRHNLEIKPIVEALEAKVGIDGSADTNSIDYKVSKVVAQLLGTQSGVTLLSPLVQGVIDGWNKFTQTLTWQSSSTLSGSGLLAFLAIGDKFQITQNVPLTSYWSFDTNSTDAKGVATMTNIGTPTYTAGKFGNALTLNGTDQALAITDAAVFKPTGAFTWRGWIKTSTDGRFIFQTYSANPTNFAGIHIGVGTGSTAHKLNFFTSNNTGTASGTNFTAIVSTTSVDDGAWHKVCCSFQSGYGKIIVDGVLEASGTMLTPAYAATNYVRIGTLSTAGSTAALFAGQIDDMDFINGYAVSEIEEAKQYALATAQTSANITPKYYGYITALTDTLLTVTGGADYVLYNSALTNPYYSHGNAVGFPDWFNTSSLLYKNDSGTALAGTQKHNKFRINGKKLDGKISFNSIADPSGSLIFFTLAVTPKLFPDNLEIGMGFAYPGTGGYVSRIFITAAYSGKGIVTTQSGSNGVEGNWAASANSFCVNYTYEI